MKQLDGYRMIGFVRDGRASLVTRRGNDWTHRFPAIAAALEELPVGNLVVDGEIVALKPDGTSDFQALQNMMRRGDDKRTSFVIGGWTEPAGGRESLGALLVGYYRIPSQLVYCGRVGTGFTRQSLEDLHARLLALEQRRSSFHEPPAGVAARGVIHWVQPKLVAEVAFAAWTADGLLRHASFQGIREDKEPAEITREEPSDDRRPGRDHRARKQ